jgi:hypothetical protein
MAGADSKRTCNDFKRQRASCCPRLCIAPHLRASSILVLHTLQSRASRFRKERRRRRLCAIAGCPEVSGQAYRCPVHANLHRQAAKAAYDLRAGLLPDA